MKFPTRVWTKLPETNSCQNPDACKHNSVSQCVTVPVSFSVFTEINLLLSSSRFIQTFSHLILKFSNFPNKLKLRKTITAHAFLSLQKTNCHKKKSNGFSVIQMDDAQVPYFFPQAWQSRSGDSLCCHQGSTISNDR